MPISRTEGCSTSARAVEDGPADLREHAFAAAGEPADGLHLNGQVARPRNMTPSSEAMMIIVCWAFFIPRLEAERRSPRPRCRHGDSRRRSLAQQEDAMFSAADAAQWLDAGGLWQMAGQRLDHADADEQQHRADEDIGGAAKSVPLSRRPRRLNTITSRSKTRSRALASHRLPGRPNREPGRRTKR